MKRFIVCLLAGMMLLASCTAKNDVGMKVGDVEVKNEYIKYIQDTYNTQSGGTVSDSVRQYAKSQAEWYAKYTALGHAMGLDAEPVYKELVKELLGENGDLDEFLTEQGMTKDVFDFIMYGDAYSDLLLEECKKEMNILPEDEDEYFMENFWRAKHLLLLTEGVTESEKAKIKEQIDSLYDDVKNGADFDELIEKYNEDPGMASNPNGYIFTDGEMVIEFQEGVANIKVGEFNLVETSYGYHIVQRLALDESDELYAEFKKSKKNQIDQVLVGDVFMDFINAKIDKYNIKTLDYTGA